MNAYDRVDNDDDVIGEMHRTEALTCGANFRTVHVFVFDSADRLLLQRLASSRQRHAGRWGSSIAAYLHTGESYERAAERRMAEELGLRGAVRRIGRTSLAEGRSTKFVELYAAQDGAARIREADHISELLFWRLGDLVSAISANPERFTPTLAHLVRFYLEDGDSSRRT